jgi:putative thioredoxin
MQILTGNGQTRPAAAGAVKDVGLKEFEAEVMRASMTRPVLVDFWAPWCGPCKQLTPLLEAAVAETKGKLSLVKVNTDANPELAQMMNIQSIPAVYAFWQGRPVDGFMGALPAGEIRKFIERLLAKIARSGGMEPEDEEMGIEAALEEAARALSEGQSAEAAALYAEIFRHVPAEVKAAAGLVRALLAMGDRDGARARLESLPKDMADKPEILSARSAVELAEQAAEAAGKLGALEKRLAEAPADHAARFDYALALLASDLRERALDELLDIFRRDRAWNEEAARKQLIKLFESWGPKDPLTLEGRRRLSALLFS